MIVLGLSLSLSIVVLVIVVCFVIIRRRRQQRRMREILAEEVESARRQLNSNIDSLRR
jgi:preprotein translocase subunit YajC